MWTMTLRRFVTSPISVFCNVHFTIANAGRATPRRCIESFAWPGEQNEVAVRITYDEGSRTPGLAPEGLNKFDACRLIFEKEWLRVIERNRSGKQLLRDASDGVNDPIVDAAKIQSRAITEHLPVEGRLAVAERDGEPEFPRVELGGDSDVSNEELGFSCEKRGHCGPVSLQSWVGRCPALG